MKQGCLCKGRASARSCLVNWLGGLLLVLAVVLGAQMPHRTMAANTVEWKEVYPAAEMGTFASEVCGDINEDGHLDLVAGSLGAGIGVAAGNGDGFVAGIISPTSQTAELDTFYRTSEPEPKFVTRSYAQELETAGSDQVYSFVLEDAQGGILYTHTFTAALLLGPGEASDTVIFAEVFPYTPAARVVLKQAEAELAARTVSAHAPTVTVLSPNGGETIGEHLAISWSASDEDGDELRYTVRYSPDDGATWLALAMDWLGTSFEADASDLSTYPGSDQARIRVIASDGVNTSQDQSDGVFSLARKPPQAHIFEPATRSYFEPGEMVVLRGTAVDAEDGPLGELGSITWASSLDGTLGSGGELWLNTLTTGVHRISLAITDSDGLTGVDEITIFVGVSREEIYLPVVLRSSD